MGQSRVANGHKVVSLNKVEHTNQVSHARAKAQKESTTMEATINNTEVVKTSKLANIKDRAKSVAARSMSMAEKTGKVTCSYANKGSRGLGFGVGYSAAQISKVKGIRVVGDVINSFADGMIAGRDKANATKVEKVVVEVVSEGATVC